ncbi:hypothetical protein Cni_G22577 [Canna indica]|uniref:Homeobox-leucine zipper protein n=1 Tax=Canna indica TaxID=4628 RepID=A0AAQ3QLA8_9LILI|nr:hypothetical protein Cni_G22577 [Canna indica]
MDPSCLIFDSSSSHSYNHGQRMIVLGGGGGGGGSVGNPVPRAVRSTVAGASEGGNKGRPFFTTPEELLEEEYYYNEQLPEKKRRLTPEQVDQLERSFKEENKLEPERKSELARKLGLQPRQVAVWFQNRRARWKNKQLEHDFDRLKSTYDVLLAGHDSLLKENERLRSQACNSLIALLRCSLPCNLQKCLSRLNLPAGRMGRMFQVTSLTEKLHDKAAAPVAAAGTAGMKGGDDQAAASCPDLTLLNAQKAEDRLSSGSGESAVADGDGRNKHWVDGSEESYYFPEGIYDCIGRVVGGRPEEDDVSDEGCNYYQQEDGQFGWWVWS